LGSQIYPSLEPVKNTPGAQTDLTIRTSSPPQTGRHFLRSCSRCEGELDAAQGEWVAEYPDKPVHGYRISQLISSKIDPGEILKEYEKAKHPERFFNLKIGIAVIETPIIPPCRTLIFPPLRPNS
jgi:hypothetical protein